MVSQYFTVPQVNGGHRRVQPPRQPVRVILSKEARAKLMENRRDKSERFQTALNDAWHKVDELTKGLAANHHKSIRRVEDELHIGRSHYLSRRKKINAWNAYCWKKGIETGQTRTPRVRVVTDMNKENIQDRSVLPNFVKQNLPEYKALTLANKQHLIEEYTQHIADKKSGVRVTTQGKVMDITQTLKAVEQELLNLRTRTGCETMMFAARGTTDLPLRGVAFHTDGVRDFIGTILGMDDVEFVSKMEGFAIQGVRGAASNHQDRISHIRGAIRHLINEKLREITGEPNATMQWKAYFRNVVSRYQVKIEGWPSAVQFVNLSSASSSQSELEMLQRNWETNTTYWKKLTDEEFEDLKQQREAQIRSGEIVEPKRRTRSDKGTKRSRTGNNSEDSSRAQKKHRSAPIVRDDEDSGETNPTTSSTSAPGNSAAGGYRATNTTSSGRGDVSGSEGDHGGNAPLSGEGNSQGARNGGVANDEITEGCDGDPMQDLADSIASFDTTFASLY